MSGNSYDLTMMRAKKSFKWLATMVGIALLVVLLGAFPGYTAAPPVVSDIPAQTIDEGNTFTTIDLDAYVTDVDNTDAEMTWSYSGK